MVRLLLSVLLFDLCLGQTLMALTWWQLTGNDCPCGHDVINYNMADATHHTLPLTLSKRAVSASNNVGEKLIWIERDGPSEDGTHYWQSYKHGGVFTSSRVKIQATGGFGDFAFWAGDTVVLALNQTSLAYSNIKTGEVGARHSIPNSFFYSMQLTPLNNATFALYGDSGDSNSSDLYVIEFNSFIVRKKFKTPVLLGVVVTDDGKVWGTSFSETSIVLHSIDVDAGTVTPVKNDIPLASPDNGFVVNANGNQIAIATAYPPGSSIVAVLLNTTSMEFKQQTFLKNFQFPSCLVPIV